MNNKKIKELKAEYKRLQKIAYVAYHNTNAAYAAYLDAKETMKKKN